MTNKEIILQTALQLFGEQGYDRTPTSQIARQAGVSEGLIFRHFNNKSELLGAIIQQGLTQIASTMQSYAAPLADPREAILLHIESALTTIRAEEKFWRLATQIRFQAGIGSAVGAQLEAVNQFVLHQLKKNFQGLGATAPAQEAHLLFALIDGICLHWLQDPLHYPLDDVKNVLIKKYEQQTF